MSHAFDTQPVPAGNPCPFMPVFGPPAIMFERGRGTELWDSNGKRYLDFLAGIAVTASKRDTVQHVGTETGACANRGSYTTYEGQNKRANYQNK